MGGLSTKVIFSRMINAVPLYMKEIENAEIHITSHLEMNLLHLHPNKHLISQALQKYNPPFKPKYYYYDNVEVNRTKFLELNDIQIFKSEFRCRLTYEKDYNEDRGEIEDFFLELYIVYRDQDDTKPLLLNLDDLLFYLNQIQNQFRRKEEHFPLLGSSLSTVEEQERYKFSTRFEHALKVYFSNYKGPASSWNFEDELTELYAILGNNLAFLYRYKERVFEEIEVKDNYTFESQIFMYPRFNNAISETAGSIYNFWERIAFFINEFFPLDSKSNTAPSYWRYFDSINKKTAKNSSLKNATLDWFLDRLYITKEHEHLNELRHPLVHYNKTRNIKGTRSADFIENRPDKNDIIKEWKYEILFLRTELDNLSIALEKVISLIEIWASNNVII